MDQEPGDNNVPEDQFSDMNRFDDFPAVEDFVILAVWAAGLQTLGAPWEIVHPTKRVNVQDDKIGWWVEGKGYGAHENLAEDTNVAEENSVKKYGYGVQAHNAQNNVPDDIDGSLTTRDGLYKFRDLVRDEIRRALSQAPCQIDNKYDHHDNRHRSKNCRQCIHVLDELVIPVVQVYTEVNQAHDEQGVHEVYCVYEGFEDFAGVGEKVWQVFGEDVGPDDLHRDADWEHEETGGDEGQHVH